MAALTLPHTSAQNGSPIDVNFWKMGEPQGAEDKQLRDNAQSAVAHWKSRAECLLGTETIAEDYVSVPFEIIKKVRVTYRQVGVLQPAPYPLDE
jgi:hypothetical protein